MTTEDKELLLKDLCSRLPYGVKCCIYNFGEDTIRIKEDILWSVQGDNILTLKSCVEKGEAYMYHQIKPYLFPLSSISDEIIDEIYNNAGVYDICIDSPVHIEVGTKFEDLFKIFDIFHKHHIDYQNLIQKGLAIDATNLNIY